MGLTRRDALGFAAGLAAAGALPARAQSDWPNRPLRILVGTSPGGWPDIVSRLFADKFAPRLGQSITVENNTGGGGGIAAGMVSNAPPDGTNLTMLTAGYASGAAVDKFPFDGDNTFGFVSMVCAYPFVYCVPKDSPIQSFPDMLARAKASPGKLSYVITSLGSVYHLIGCWVGMKAGIDMMPITYRGSSAAVTDVLAGRVDVMLDTATSGFPRIRSGQFRALAVTVAGALSPAAGRSDRGGDVARRALHVMARALRGAAHTAADRRASQRRGPPRAGPARRAAEAHARAATSARRRRPRRCASRWKTRSPTGGT